jgi:hypothetical protein
MSNTHRIRMYHTLRRIDIKIEPLFVFALLLLIGFFNVPTNAQVINWAIQAGGSLSDTGNGIIVDEEGNSYVAGHFVGPAIFGEGENAVTLTGIHSNDIFVAKYDSSSNLVWVKQAGGNSDDISTAITLDRRGNIYISGYFSGTATFGEGDAAVMLNGVGGPDIFIAKFDNDGQLVWAAQTLNTNFFNIDIAWGIAVDDMENSVISGYFRGVTTFGDGDTAITVTSGGIYDIFVAKYDSEGHLLWVKTAGGEVSENAIGIVVDGAGNSIVTGTFFSSSITFGEGASAITLTNNTNGTGDVFIVKYDSDGNLVWAKQAGGPSSDVSSGIAADRAGNSYIAGQFRQTAVFGDLSNSTTLTSSGSEDIFIAKYDTNGNFVWAKQAGGVLIDTGRSLAVHEDGTSYVTGLFQESATFGEGDYAVTLDASSSSVGAFVAKYDNSGNLVSVISPFSGFSVAGNSIGLDSVGNHYVTGIFFGTATFGEGANTITRTSSGAGDIFVAKYIHQIPVSIDIWPNRSPNVINLHSRMIPVTIFSTPTFDATTEVDRNSLTFGRNGNEDSLHRRGNLNVPGCTERDMNDDGLIDIRCFFSTHAAGFQVGDTVGILRGLTFSNVMIEGRDMVEVASGDR